MSRGEIVKALKAERAAGRPIVGAGAGTGISAKSAEAGGADLIIIYNSGRFRMAGRGSIAGLMPYGDANQIVVEMAADVIPVVREVPVPAGTVDYIYPGEYTLPQALETLNILLQTQSVMLRVEGDRLFLQKLEDMKRENVPTFVGKLPSTVTDDQIVSIVHAKDLLMAMLRGRVPSLRALMRPAYFVPENKNLHELLGELRKNRTQMAVVQDEFGGTAGIVTIEDIVEEGAARARRDVLLAAILFVAGFSTVFVALGATASVFGQFVRANLHVLSMLAGVAIIGMGLHFLGVFKLHILYREKRMEVEKPVGLWGAYVMGLAFAFGWTPCIGPILAAILAVASSEETVARGAGLLAVYSFGLGVPFLLAALAIEPFMNFLKGFRSHFGKVEKLVGAALVVTGIAFLTGGMQTLSIWLLETFPGLAKLG